MTAPKLDEFPDVPPPPPSAVSAPPPAPPKRAAGWQYADRLYCPAGHLMTRRDTFLTGTLIARCECGRAVLAIALANLLVSNASPSRLVFTIEVTKAEAVWLRRERPSLDTILDHAGLLLGAPERVP